MEENEYLEVSIMPIREFGYDDSEEDSVQLQQGMDIDTISVMKGETFLIEQKYEGWVENDDGKYKLVQKDIMGNYITLEDTDQIPLEPGKYLFHHDGITIEFIES